MRKQTTLLHAFAVGVCLFLFHSCVKPPNFNPCDGGNVYNGCRIKQTINQPTVESSVITRQFAYNGNNDPVSITSNIPSTGNPNIVFKYDNKKRLIEYSGIYTNGLYEFVHRYGYSYDRIVTDTQYVFGTYGSLTDYWSKRYKYLSYDNFNRIVKDSEVYVAPAPLTNVLHYSYDIEGNLINGKTYDNKLNPHRTNKIWMFIDRNYSVNNPVAANTYNSAGLPLTYSSAGYELDFAYIFYYGSTQIVYDCK